MENQTTRLKEFGPWSEQNSSSGKRYYYNRETEVSQWEKPTEWRQAEKEQERLKAKVPSKSNKSSNEHSSHSSSKQRHQHSRTSLNNNNTSPGLVSGKTTTSTAPRHNSSSHANHHHQNSTSSTAHNHHHSSSNNLSHLNGVKRRRMDEDVVDDGNTPTRRTFENTHFSDGAGSRVPDSSSSPAQRIPPTTADAQTSSNSFSALPPKRNSSSFAETKRPHFTPLKSSPGCGDQRSSQPSSCFPSSKAADQSAHSNFSEFSNHQASSTPNDHQQQPSRWDSSYASKDLHQSFSRNKSLSTPSPSVQNGQFHATNATNRNTTQSPNAKIPRLFDLAITPVLRDEKYQKFYRPDMTSFRRNWTSDNYLNEAKKCAERISKQTVHIASIDSDIKSVRSLMRAADLRSSLTAQRLADVRQHINDLNVS